MSESEELELSDSEREVWHWRFDQCLNFGLDAIDAQALASSKADLHEIENLINAGCSSRLVLAILL